MKYKVFHNGVLKQCVVGLNNIYVETLMGLQKIGVDDITNSAHLPVYPMVAIHPITKQELYLGDVLIHKDSSTQVKITWNIKLHCFEISYLINNISCALTNELLSNLRYVKHETENSLHDILSNNGIDSKLIPKIIKKYQGKLSDIAIVSLAKNLMEFFND